MDVCMLKMEPWRVYSLVVAYSHPFEQELDQDLVPNPDPDLDLH
jgi:hypothetical protein